jgi:hypothetical protein
MLYRPFLIVCWVRIIDGYSVLSNRLQFRTFWGTEFFTHCQMTALPSKFLVRAVAHSFFEGVTTI